MPALLESIVISVASVFVLSLLSLLFESIRATLFYKRTEYDLMHYAWRIKPGDPGGSQTWEIQWEDHRLTLSVAHVENHRLEGVIFTRNNANEEKFDMLTTSDSFKPLFQKELYFKLHSIIYTWGCEDVARGNATLTLRFVFRRRRW
jgi:hypothetical protein